jgi:UDP-glucose 4-epimerase
VTIAITGGTGFVGQAVIDEACRQGLPLRALARREQAQCEGVEWVRGDLADRTALAVLVVVSSLAAREPGLSKYGASKRHAEELVQASGLDWTIVRPPAIYGPRDREIFEMFRAARWGVVPMPPNGKASMIHVADLARLLLALKPGWPGVRRRIFEPDDGHPGGWSHTELAKAIGQAVGRSVWAPSVPAGLMRAGAWLDGRLRGKGAKLTSDRIGYMLHPDWVSSPDKALPAELWRAEIATMEGLKSTARWYREQGWL